MITVTGKATFDDYLRAQRDHSRKRDLTIIISLAVIAVFVVAVSRNYVFPAIVLGYLAIRPFYMRSRSKRFWDQTPSAHQGEKSYGLDETGFHATDDEGNPSVTHWDKFLKWRESEHTFFLYLSPHMFLFFPKRLVATEDCARIRQLLKEGIEPERVSSKAAADADL
jgi:hypothetical protein